MARFEKLVAAIHQLEEDSSLVEWNQTIAGRQFDIVIHRKVGLYDLQTLIECKDYKSPVSVDKIDAFATKYRDAGAHHAAFASKSGFPSGCFEVARRHQIDLLTVNEDPDGPFERLGCLPMGKQTSIMSKISFASLLQENRSIYRMIGHMPSICRIELRLKCAVESVR